tara:strand:- start:211 stop:378 length:168 start_codon:yes stop_codon:yes gene_type:complete
MLKVIAIIAFGYLLYSNPTARNYAADGMRSVANVIEVKDHNTPQWKNTIKELIGD